MSRNVTEAQAEHNKNDPRLRLYLKPGIGNCLLVSASCINSAVISRNSAGVVPSGAHFREALVVLASYWLFFLFARPLHTLYHGLFKVHREQAEQEEYREWNENIQAGEQLYVIQNIFVEEVDAHACTYRKH